MRRGALIACGIGALAILFLTFAAGWAVNGWRLGQEIEQIKLGHQADMTKFAVAATDRLKAALVRGDKLQLQLAEEEQHRLEITREKDREIRNLTTGRRCLDAAAVRLLNAADSSTTGSVPEASGGAVRPDARFATDTDVGLWINQCRQSYDTCRGHLRAIGEFYEGADD